MIEKKKLNKQEQEKRIKAYVEILKKKEGGKENGNKR